MDGWIDGMARAVNLRADRSPPIFLLGFGQCRRFVRVLCFDGCANFNLLLHLIQLVCRWMDGLGREEIRARLRVVEAFPVR